MLRALAVLAAAGATALALDALRCGTLYDLSFPSGWLLAAALALGAVSLHALGARPSTGRMRIQMAVTTVALALLLFHVDFHVPRGWLEIALSTAFLAGAVSTVHGADLVLRGGADVHGPVVARWIRRQAVLNAVLLVFTSFHALVVHAHGALAYLLLGAKGS